MGKSKTQILLACYNGRSYLEAQMRSLIAQSETDWELLVRDDGSFDGTNAILRRWAAKDERVTLVEGGGSTGSAKKNFARLMQAADGDYVLFCDQDDVWHPDKLQKSRAAMRALEEQHGKQTPLLVHSDLRVVDQDGGEIAPSMAAYQKLDLTRTGFCQLLSQNVVTGCTVMINRALLEKGRALPEEAVMHDWYLALIAACFGAVGLVQQATLDYRQHAQNQVGSKNAGSAQYIAARAAQGKKSRQVLRDTYAQADAFVRQFGSEMPEAYRRAAEALAEMPRRSKPMRWRTLGKYHLYKHGLVRKAGQIFYC